MADDKVNPKGGPTRPMKPGSEAPAGTPGTGDALCPVCHGIKDPAETAPAPVS